MEQVLAKVVSGGQAGVDRAALDVALEIGVPCGGWCPKGRMAEDGPLPPCYPLEETPSETYRQRTEWNVRDSDATLVLSRGPVTGGTAETVTCAARMNRPCLLINLAQPRPATDVHAWVSAHQVRVLNVAGPRESKSPGIYAQAAAFLRQVFTPYHGEAPPAKVGGNRGAVPKGSPTKPRVSTRGAGFAAP